MHQQKPSTLNQGLVFTNAFGSVNSLRATCVGLNLKKPLLCDFLVNVKNIQHSSIVYCTLIQWSAAFLTFCNQIGSLKSQKFIFGKRIPVDHA